MGSNVVLGVVAGAAGSAALNIATYADMVVRGRSASEVPAKLAGTLAEQAGVDLQGTGDEAEKTAENRRSGLGALMGYVTGLGIGGGYGLLYPWRRHLPLPLAGAGVGIAAMAASDVPATAAGATDPAEWGASGWLLDLGFHLVYGLTTVAVYDVLAEL
jgi:hypothetical protein